MQRAQQQGQTPPPGAGSTDSAQSSPAVSGEATINRNPGPQRLASGNSRAGFKRKLAAKRKLGGATFARTLRLGTTARSAGKVRLTIRSATGSIVSRVSAPVKAGRSSVRVRAQITGVRGRYRWSARYAGETVGKGRFRVAGKPAAAAQLKANQTLVCRIIT